MYYAINQAITQELNMLNILDKMLQGEIWVSHGDKYEDGYLLGCRTL
jgi:hypothetical protein